jgi:hypothetical protein
MPSPRILSVISVFSVVKCLCESLFGDRLLHFTLNAPRSALSSNPIGTSPVAA